jgi:hypothetical protein
LETLMMEQQENPPDSAVRERGKQNDKS